MISSATFVDDLLSALPEADEMVREHLDDQAGELLLDLLVSDLDRAPGSGGVWVTARRPE